MCLEKCSAALKLAKPLYHTTTSIAYMLLIILTWVLNYVAQVWACNTLIPLHTIMYSAHDPCHRKRHFKNWYFWKRLKLFSVILPIKLSSLCIICKELRGRGKTIKTPLKWPEITFVYVLAQVLSLLNAPGAKTLVAAKVLEGQLDWKLFCTSKIFFRCLECSENVT